MAWFQCIACHNSEPQILCLNGHAERYSILCHRLQVEIHCISLCIIFQHMFLIFNFNTSFEEIVDIILVLPWKFASYAMAIRHSLNTKAQWTKSSMPKRLATWSRSRLMGLGSVNLQAGVSYLKIWELSCWLQKKWMGGRFWFGWTNLLRIWYLWGLFDHMLRYFSHL